MSDLQLATELLEQGNLESAARELERVLSTNFDNMPAWKLLARAVTDPNDIKDCYQQVLRLDPDDTEALSALNEMGILEDQTDIPPFFSEDLGNMNFPWMAEPPAQPGIDTSPLKIVDSIPVLPPVVDDVLENRREWTGSPEGALFDDDIDEENGHPQRKTAKGSVLDNDSFFYTVIVVVVVVVLAVVIYALRGTITSIIQNGWPF
jgi:hypothetical protein